ncbi:pentatricopeptide repeat-containing protein, partial [Trifolium medium]|nr:pentatricopeptide repeat-containing protein [Trifolium medium]
MARTEQGKWKRLWKVHAPPKAKHLIWRICKDCLPTRIRLQQSRNAWQAAGLESIILPHLQRFNTIRDCILNICSETDRNTAGKAAMLMWILWNNRNNAVWNQSKETGQQLGVKAMCFWSEWEAVQTARGSSNQPE